MPITNPGTRLRNSARVRHSTLTHTLYIYVQLGPADAGPTPRPRHKVLRILLVECREGPAISIRIAREAGRVNLRTRRRKLVLAVAISRGEEGGRKRKAMAGDQSDGKTAITLSALSHSAG